MIEVVSHAERPELHERWAELVGAAWPEFMYHDAVCREHWWRLTEQFGGFQLYALDGAELVGGCNTIPFAWDGDAEALPEGIDGVLALAAAQREAGVAPAALCALQATVSPSRRGEGLSAQLVRAMTRLAAARGLRCLVAPVRPTWKARYPLAPIERYAAWTREDGLPFDPWLRVHARLGAEVVAIAHHSMVIRGAVAEWEDWSGLAFPESGRYVVPGALVPVEIDRGRDEGIYVEPNVWMRHPPAAG